MGSTFECILAIFLFTLLVKGHAQSCDIKDISIVTNRTDREVQGKPEWDVSITNTCKDNCSQKSVTVSCYNFQSAEEVDPKDFRPIGDNNCLVNDGGPIGTSEATRFFYAWDSPFVFTPGSSKVECS